MRRSHEIRHRIDGSFAVWRENYEREGASAWDCIAVFDNIDDAKIFRARQRDAECSTPS